MSEQALEVRQRIRALLVDVYGNDRLVSAVSDSGSLRQAGVSSTALVSLLVAMEEAFEFEWDEDVRPEVFRSIESLADHVLSLRN